MAEDVAGVLEEVIRRRRSVRAFAPDVPERGLVERVLDAGMYAPYAALAYAGRMDFRRFFVFEGTGQAAGELREIVRDHTAEAARRIRQQLAGDPAEAKRAAPFLQRLEHASLPDAPWILLVAEPNGMPPVTPQSLAHCMENLWLMAAALDLGMQLLSLFESMGANPRLCALLGLNPGEWSLNGCALGYPAAPPTPAQRPDTRALTTWL